jgi:hypothetical protein
VSGLHGMWNRRPILTKGKLSDLDDLIQKMKHGKLIGRAVVECC